MVRITALGVLILMSIGVVDAKTGGAYVAIMAMTNSGNSEGVGLGLFLGFVIAGIWAIWDWLSK